MNNLTSNTYSTDLSIDPQLAALIATGKPQTKTAAKQGLYFRTASALTGDPILVAFQMGASKNSKLGDMVQVWIMPESSKPTDSIKDGLQEAVCGKCWFASSGTCYVNPVTVNQVWSAVERGSYRELELNDNGFKALVSALYGRHVRIGAWGDPAAMPWPLMASIVDNCAGHTAYTHQVDHPSFDPRFSEVCMVSVENPKQAERLQRLGYRTFRARTEFSQLTPREIECPSVSSGLSCADCRLCDGKDAKRGTVSVSIPVHGLDWKVQTFNNRWASAPQIDVLEVAA